MTSSITAWLKKSSLVLLLFLTLILTGSGTPAKAQGGDTIYIIVNKSLSVSSLSKSDASRIFRKEKSRLGSVAMMPINAKTGSNLRKAFTNRVLNMSVSEEQTYWQEQKVKTGKQPPSELADTVKAVFLMRTGISYCFASQFKEGTAKILLKI